MELSVAETVCSGVNITPPKSARKRILFTSSPSDENSDGTLGHMSPLNSSSPDRYSSPPPSPQWLVETPPRKCVLNQSPLGPIQRKIESSKPPRTFCFDLHASSVQKLPPSKSQEDSRGRDERTVDPVTDMELVEESPMKGPSNMGLTTPFRCLADKENEDEETPKLKSRKLIIGESPDIFSAAAPIKMLQKSKPDNEAGTVLKSSHASTGVCKLSSLSTSFFYHTTRARAALFPEHFSKSKNTVSSVLNSKKRKRSVSAESHSRICFSLSRSRSKVVKRYKHGEINAGVHHGIKKYRKKILYKYPVDPAQPKIKPEDRIESYLNKFEESNTRTKDSNKGRDAHFIPSHSIQAVPADNSLKSSGVPLASDRMKLIPPSSPVLDPSKKFFKTQRTLKINSNATVTVDKNIKLKVSNGKFFLSKSNAISRSGKIPKVDLLESYQNRKEFTENSIAEVVQERVHDSVEILLKNLEESSEKDNLPAVRDIPSPDHHISSITTSASSLAIDDGPPPEEPCTSQTFSCPSYGNAFEAGVEDNSENLQENQTKFLFVNPQEDENPSAEGGDANKYFPIFTKSPSSRKIADLTNVKSVRAKKRPWRSIGDNQYIIDAGQKKFGATQCKECCIVYQIGDPDDEMSHQKYHNSADDLKYTPWKQERVVAYYGIERVILIKPSDSKPWLNKMKNVLNVVDKELGYVDAELGNLSNSQIYLYVTDKQVIGCVVAHPIKFAYKMLNSVIEGCDCCSEESYPAKCGVSRVWVAKNYRRKKIASKIMDCMRSSFLHGYVLGVDEFAFSAPTLAGKAFAEKYTGTVNYLVYT